MNDTSLPHDPLPPESDPNTDAAETVTPTSSRSRGLRLVARHLRGLRGVLTFLLVLAVLYTLVLAQSLIIPLVLAIFIGLGLNPVVALLARWRIPRSLAALVLLVGIGFGIGTGVNMLAQPATQWLQRAPTALHHITLKLKPLTQRINKASQATRSMAGDKGSARPPAAASTDTGSFTAWDVLQMTPRVLASVLTVTLLVFFFLIYGDEMLRRLVEISPTFRKKRHNVTLIRNIQFQVSRYLLTTTLINLSLGVLTSAWLWWMGISDPMLWGGIAALVNFIPYVGAITMTLLLTVVGLLQFHSPLHGLLPAAGFACLTIAEGNFITPLILGQSMRLSPVAILIWLLIWGWMWGIPGVLLAVLMLTSVKLITEQLPNWRWFSDIVERRMGP